MKSLTDQQDFEIHDKMLQFVFVRILSACQTEKNADFKQTKNIGFFFRYSSSQNIQIYD